MSVDFRKLFRAMQQRPDMYLADRRFESIVAYIDGCDAATEGQLLLGFREWLYDTRLGSREGSLVWSAVLKSARGLYEDSATPRLLTTEESDQLMSDAFESIDQYLALNKHVFRVEPTG